jgi:hypothetical protein
LMRFLWRFRSTTLVRVQNRLNCELKFFL